MSSGATVLLEKIGNEHGEEDLGLAVRQGMVQDVRPFPTTDEMSYLATLAESMVHAKLCGVENKAEALLVLQTVWDLNIPISKAWQSIHLIPTKGGAKRITMGADLMRALVNRSGLISTTIGVCDASSATITMERVDGLQPPVTVSFTIEEAKKAGLAGKDNWQSWTGDMLFARAYARCARRYCPEIIGGFYLPEEVREVDQSQAVEKRVAHLDFVDRVVQKDAPAVIGRSGAKALRGQVADLARDRGIAQKTLSAEFERLVADAEVRNADYLTHAQADDIADKLRIIASDIAEEAAQAEPEPEPEVAADDDPFGGE